jgi:hypothetical protein
MEIGVVMEKSGKSMEHWIFRERYRKNWTRGVLCMIDRNGHCTLDGPIEKLMRLTIR